MSSTNENYPEIRAAVTKLCSQFPGEYWRALDDTQIGRAHV